jgi:membrane protein
MDRTSHDGSTSDRPPAPPAPEDPRKPDELSDLRTAAWKYAAKQAWAEFRRDDCTDLAAALTYYAVLSLFPALLVMVSLVGLFGQGASTADTLLELIERIGQEDAVDQLRQPITSLTQNDSAGIAFALGLLVAIWSASAYIGAFGRAMNRIYEVDEGRPFWKLRPLNLILTVVTVSLAAIVLLGLVVTGPFATELGATLGVGDGVVTVWNIAKWPLLLIVVVIVVAVLYYATPNVRQPRFRWISVGAALAIVVWIIASLGFGIYVSNFSSYDETYGALGGVIILLLWLWLTNLALLFGAEIDSELERSRQLQAGIPAEENLQLPPRDTRASESAAAKLDEQIDEGRRLRETSATTEGPGGRMRGGESG